MRKIINWMMREMPYTEVWMRRLFSEIKKNRLGAKVASTKRVEKKATPNMNMEQVERILCDLGVQKGDFLIVHSSMDGLKNVNISAVEWIKLLQRLVGNEGTISFAAFQEYGKKDIIVEDGKKITVYNPSKIKVSSGLLPNVFCRMPDVIRSKCPSNSLAAWGKEAKNMMTHNLDGDLAHGKNSAWYYAVQHHAKILYLGIPVTEADTVVHVVEDCMDEKWPITNWYKKSDFYIIDGKSKIRKTIRLRDGYWHRYFTAQYSGKILDKNHLRRKAVVNGTTMELIPDSKQYIDFLTEEAQKGKLLYRIPKKYWRNNQ